MSAWTPYQPSAAAPWNLQRVVHLHRRVAFGASWEEIQRDLADGPEGAVKRLLEGKSRLAGAPDDFEALSGVIGQAAADSGSPQRLKAWWLYRCLFTPHPLEERLTLVWHNHFATSNLKVDDLKLMKRQNECLRKHALAPFGDLLRAMVHDPALLNWLDAPQNRAGHPNENLGRELMELFTLGIGHYSEHDVKQAARALTGWTVKHGEFQTQASQHDGGEKEILGRIGNWSGEELVNILLEQRSTAQRLAWRLTSELCGEGVASPPALEELADYLHKETLDIRHGIERILRSDLFFSPANIGSRVSDPVSFLIGLLRGLDCWRQSPSTLVLAEWVSRMGQDLFYPPNVGGWPGGRAWLSTRTTIARVNCMAALVGGQLSSPPQPPDFAALAEKHAGGTSDEATRQIVARVVQGRDCEKSKKTVLEVLTAPEACLH